jgi:hypothetical protein
LETEAAVRGGDTRAKAAARGKKVGRPPLPSLPFEQVRIGADAARRLLDRLDWENKLVEIFERADDRMKVQMIFRLHEAGHGRYKEEDKNSSVPPVVRVIVEHMGRPQDQVSAKAK